ncbi:hypothetical protein CPB84DRAFT_1486932 [Gymnopilus junonius]|uniref:F-box domain-containing protein n=1 Tax=Gymnopilus junonius TaxID=109634 RepID=A0A9P5TK79_GYMJU|nr:hypothetical protein CPB84DRAFT_1486932 [Gymnopilus junonius]
MHVNDLPVELLSEIFAFATFEKRLAPNNLNTSHLLVFFHKKSAPFNLIHVCQHWRIVALLHPSLWAYLDGTQYKAFQPSVSAVAFWLQCSRSVPLRFRISSRNDKTKSLFNPHHARQMLLLFSRHLYRWTSLSLEAGNDLAIDFLAVLRESGCHLPPLEALEVELGCGDIKECISEELAASFCNMKTLRQIYWVNAWGHALPRLPWGQYNTVYNRSSFTPEEILECVAQCTSSKSISIQGLEILERPIMLSNLPHTSLMHLTSLTLDQSSDPLPFLSCFTLPTLRHLEIRLYQREFRLLEEFLQRSKCPLQDLTVIDTTLSAVDVANFFNLQGLQSIKNVKLVPTHREAEMVRFLKYFEGTCVRLPPLMAWRESISEWPLLIGWKENNLHRVRYLLKNGKLTTR